MNPETLPLTLLVDWLRDELAALPGNIVIVAGHYCVFSKGQEAADLLDDSNVLSGCSEHIDFAKFTWTVACEAIARSGNPNVRLLVLADDVHFVRPHGHGIAERAKASVELRNAYYLKSSGLPAFHRGILGNFGLRDDCIVKHSNARWVFSEQDLQTSFVSRLKGLLRSSARPNDLLEVSDDLGTIAVRDPSHGNYFLVHSGHTNCTGSFAELGAELSERNVDYVISLLPMRCAGPVAAGAGLLRHLGLSRCRLTNIILPKVGALEDAEVLRISE